MCQPSFSVQCGGAWPNPSNCHEASPPSATDPKSPVLNCLFYPSIRVQGGSLDPFLREIFCFVSLCFQPLFFTQDDFTLAHELVVQPQTVFVCGCFAPGARRAAEQPHACRSLKNVR